jgi:hypothetical protein
MFWWNRCGKSNALLNYIHRTSGELFQIIICSFSTTDEALHNMLHEKEQQIHLINNIGKNNFFLETFSTKHVFSPSIFGKMSF